MQSPNYDVVSPREAYASYLMGSVLVDVRTKSEIENTKIPLNHLLTIPMEELEGRISELPSDRRIIFFSRVGVKGEAAARLMAAHGYPKVALVDGGVTAWEQEGLPVQH
ncbi:MAG: rhodanese-like domain-containing protein [Chitinophagales bacterium]|jgi:rhodanese-related sulfurtransferase